MFYKKDHGKEHLNISNKIIEELENKKHKIGKAEFSANILIMMIYLFNLKRRKKTMKNFLNTIACKLRIKFYRI